MVATVKGKYFVAPKNDKNNSVNTYIDAHK